MSAPDRRRQMMIVIAIFGKIPLAPCRWGISTRMEFSAREKRGAKRAEWLHGVVQMQESCRRMVGAFGDVRFSVGFGATRVGLAVWP
jgi:hypothetical protein